MVSSLLEVVNINRVESLQLYEYLDDVVFIPGDKWPRCQKEIRLHSRWAIIEIIVMIDNNPMIPCVEIIKEFIDKMDDYYARSSRDSVRIMFEVARETGKDVLDLYDYH